MALVAGVDVGTTNTKALLYDLGRGRVVAVASRPTITHHPLPVRSEFDAEELWQGAAACMREVMARCDTPGAVAGIAVASMAEAGVPLDPAGRPVSPVIAWYDERTSPQRDRWEATVGPARSYALSGQMMRHTFGAHKLVWLREHEPEAFARIACWIGVADWIAYRLCGVLATDYTLAARTLLFEPGAARWSDDLLAYAGLSRSLLPPALPSGTRLGGVTAAAAAATGLPTGIAVVTGGHDHLCGALAAGVVEPGTVLDSTGTAESLVLVRPSFAPDEETRVAGMASYHHVVPGKYVLLGGLTQSGGLVRWVAEQLWTPPGEEGTARAGADTAALFARAAALPRGAEGVVCLPYLLGTGMPHPDPRARAAFVGLRPHHTHAHLLRAALEALGQWLAEGLTTMERLSGTPSLAHDVVAIGGATAMPLWMQIKADTTGRPIRVPELHEAVALGAALLAALGSGLVATAAAACATVRVPTTIYQPDAAAHAFYAGTPREVYRRLYPALREINHLLDRA
jgi:xylulokinase